MQQGDNGKIKISGRLKIGKYNIKLDCDGGKLRKDK